MLQRKKNNGPRLEGARSAMLSNFGPNEGAAVKRKK
jgi:hypothetical protein